MHFLEEGIVITGISLKATCTYLFPTVRRLQLAIQTA
ncbi:hypothetical protein SAMN05216588_12762 [Pseudomonas flavescens]|uniref:Uncharacterized protein n=1 Tax=Phytopseudomonas flavescens TaxID=29435 RepID=A0A1G8P7P1_9GAMM|nr:hypothetical protein SAMN05216588_12762 [Pseudomonas flavescens]